MASGGRIGTVKDLRRTRHRPMRRHVTAACAEVPPRIDSAGRGTEPAREQSSCAKRSVHAHGARRICRRVERGGSMHIRSRTTRVLRGHRPGGRWTAAPRHRRARRAPGRLRHEHLSPRPPRWAAAVRTPRGPYWYAGVDAGTCAGKRMVMDIQGPWTTAGTQAHMWSWYNGQSQYWCLAPIQNGEFRRHLLRGPQLLHRQVPGFRRDGLRHPGQAAGLQPVHLPSVVVDHQQRLVLHPGRHEDRLRVQEPGQRPGLLPGREGLRVQGRRPPADVELQWWKEPALLLTDGRVAQGRRPPDPDPAPRPPESLLAWRGVPASRGRRTALHARRTPAAERRAAPHGADRTAARLAGRRCDVPDLPAELRRLRRRRHRRPARPRRAGWTTWPGSASTPSGSARCSPRPSPTPGTTSATTCTVAPRYGTQRDLAALVDDARGRGIRIMLDLVAGHTSDQHPWFRASADDPGDDRYIWSDGTASPGPAWVPPPAPAPGHYLPNFYPAQPALNFGYARTDPAEPWRQPVDAARPARQPRGAARDHGVLVRPRCRGLPRRHGVLPGQGRPRPFRDRRPVARDAGLARRAYPGRVLLSEWGDPKTSVPAGFHADFFLHFVGPRRCARCGATPQGSQRPAWAEDPCYFDPDGAARCGSSSTPGRRPTTAIAARGLRRPAHRQPRLLPPGVRAPHRGRWSRPPSRSS